MAINKMKKKEAEPVTNCDQLGKPVAKSDIKILIILPNMQHKTEACITASLLLNYLKY